MHKLFLLHNILDRLINTAGIEYWPHILLFCKHIMKFPSFSSNIDSYKENGFQFGCFCMNKSLETGIRICYVKTFENIIKAWLHKIFLIKKLYIRNFCGVFERAVKREAPKNVLMINLKHVFSNEAQLLYKCILRHILMSPFRNYVRLLIDRE